MSQLQRTAFQGHNTIQPVNKTLHVFLPPIPIFRIKPAAGQFTSFDLLLRPDSGIFQGIRKVISKFQERRS